MVILPTWWFYTLRLGALLVAVVALRAGFHGLLGRPVTVMYAGAPKTVSGWWARVFALLAFLCAGLALMFAFLVLGR